MARGWGRRATGKVDRKLEDDALFKEIGGQLGSTNFDYTQWQRTRKSSIGNVGRKSIQDIDEIDILKSDNILKARSPFVVSAPPGPSFPKYESARVTSIKHKKSRRVKEKEDANDPAKKEQIKVLQLRIQARKKTLEEYKLREQQLFEENIKLQEEIENEEGASHDAVKKLLRKYEKFRGGLTTLNSKFAKDFEVVQNDLHDIKSKIDRDLGALQLQVNEADKRLKDEQTKLSVLMSYKDKEYPVKALQITDLQKELAQLKIYHQDEEAELTRIVDYEIDKLRREQVRTKNDITKEATKCECVRDCMCEIYQEESMSKMHPSLKKMALQNIAMKKELEFHKNELIELEEANKNLAENVKKLLKDPKTSIRQQMFPEFYPNKPKCTPDMEVVLDIPTQEWLPI